MTEPQALPEGFHENSIIQEMPLELIKIDRSYQRDASQTLIDEIAANWDEVASELVLISDRGEGREDLWPEHGRFYLINGQHRSWAARKRNHVSVWARVVDLSFADDPAAIEASLRLKTNVRLGDRPLERFKAQLRAGDEASHEIVRILDSFDTQINTVPESEHGINAVSAVEKIHEAGLLYDTMALLKDAFDTLGGRAVSSSMMRATAWFIEKHAFESDRYRIVEKLKLNGTAAMYRRAITFQSTMGNSLWVNYYRTMVDLYNEKLTDKNRLEFRLRGQGKLGTTKATTQWK